MKQERDAQGHAPVTQFRLPQPPILQALPFPALWGSQGQDVTANASFHALWQLPSCDASGALRRGLQLLLRTDGQPRYCRLTPSSLDGYDGQLWLVEDVHEFLIDPLTGLPGRHALDQSHAPVAEGLELTMIDLDHLKKLNDSHGHAAGDAALRLLGQLIARQCAASHNTAFRIGGNEFLLVRHPHHQDFDLKALHLDFHILAESELGLPGLHFSAGRASCPPDGKLLCDLMYLADRRMYRVKQQHHALDAGVETMQGGVA